MYGGVDKDCIVGGMSGQHRNPRSDLWPESERQMTVVDLIEQLIENKTVIVQRLIKNHAVTTYASIQSSLKDTNVAMCTDFQERFKKYYAARGKMREKNGNVSDAFFSILESEKRNMELSFQEVLCRMYRETGRVEPVFSSKLVATVRQDYPPYDSYVGDNLGVHMPIYSDKKRQLRSCLRAYSLLFDMISKMIRSDLFVDLSDYFDCEFPGSRGVSEVKKLDFFLWQYRPCKEGVKKDGR